jgi:glycosyltransferase involved in cell wall biosynthesis
MMTGQADAVRKPLATSGRVAIVLSPTWPVEDTGYGLAVRASLKLYLRHYERVHFVAITHLLRPDTSEWPADRVEFYGHHAWNAHPAIRFARSVFSRYPALTLRYRSQEKVLLNKISSWLKQAKHENSAVSFIIEDVPTGIHIDNLKSLAKHIPIAVRSHNALYDSFVGFAGGSNKLVNLAWRFELRKTHIFEGYLLEEADAVWAITGEELASYHRRYGVKGQGVIGIGLDPARYTQPEKGDSHTVVFVGKADLRKAAGLREFLKDGWTEVRRQIPDARLRLCGPGTKSFNDPSNGVDGLGFVEDVDREVAYAAIAINPQRIGGGIKLKSIVSMLSGRAFVSTENGVEGLDGIDGEHFAVGKTPFEMGQRIAELMLDQEAAARMAEQGRLHAVERFSESAFFQETDSLVALFAKLAREV